MRILYFAPVFPPEQSGGATHIYELAREWTALGHSVTVTKGFPSHPSGRVPERYHGKLYAREELDGIEVIYTWLYATPNVGFFKRTLGYFTGALCPLVANLCMKKRYDVIIGTCPHIFLVLAAFAMGFLTRTPYVYEIRDKWPDAIVALGQIRNRFVIRVLEAIEVFLYRRAKLVVTVTSGVRNSVVSRGVGARKVVHIPNGVDCDFFHPVDRKARTRLRQELGVEEKFVVSYFGTFGLSQGLSVVTEAAELLRENKDIVFVLAGDGAERGMLLERKESSGLDNVIFLPPQPRERMPEFYGASDVGLVPLRNLELFKHTIPSKMFELMACGVPTILGVDGEARRILDRSQAGAFVLPEDPHALVETIMKLKSSPGAASSMRKAGPRFVRENYDRRELACRFARTMKTILQAR